MAEGVSSANVAVILIDFGVNLILERSLLMQGYILEVDIVPDRIALVHYFDLFIPPRKLQKLLRVCNIMQLLLNIIL